MTRSHDCRFTRRIDAPVEVVWDVLTDHARYRNWTAVPHSRLVTAGSGDDPNGVDAVRFLGVGPIGAKEKVLVSEPPSHLAYTVVSGLPVRDYRADARLQDVDGATELVYTSTFRPIVPGTGPVIALVVRTVLRTLVASLAAESERPATDVRSS
jgi:uncharacterized protein YndB with AHSA1/START domain